MSSVTSSSSVRNAYDVLRSIRRVKTTMQLQEAYEILLSFMRTTRQELLERAALASTPLRKGSPRSSSSGSHPTANRAASAHLNREAQTAMSQLKQISLLCGAFCRRVEHVLRSTYAYADVDDAMHRGPSSLRLSDCMASLSEEMKLFDNHLLHRYLGVSGKDSPTAWSSVGTSVVDCALTYGAGDLSDYRLYRRVRAQSYLQQLLAQPQWNTAAVTAVVVALSETLAVPVDTFDLCSADEAVEATCVITPLRDPISQTVIRTPARGPDCVHLEMFDVESFVRATQQRALGTVDVGGPCPLCSRFVSLSAIRVDKRALEAMKACESVSPGTATPPPLTADGALEWNAAERTVTVLQSRRPGASAAPIMEMAAMNAAAAALDEDMDETQTPPLAPRSEPPSKSAAKKRRIEIGGHVLYAD